MPKRRMQTWLALVALGVGLILVAIVGLWAYMLMTATPLHPNPQKAPSTALAAPSPAWTGAIAQAQQIVRASLTEQNLPGLSVAVGKTGEILWAEGFGWTDLATKVGVTPATRFRVAEASKALTSAGAGLLIEQNKLNLDAEIHTYVPAYPQKQWPVTVRQLMAHVGGLRDDAGDDASLEPCKETAEGLRMFAGDPLLFQPGTAYRASAYSWILVSAAVEAAAGERFFRFMRSQVFDPIGMQDTRPDVAADDLANRATFYFPRFAGDTRYGPESAREGDHSCYAGASGFLSTPSDLVRFGMAFGGGKLLQPATVQLLQSPQRLKSGEETGYGLGWKLETMTLGGSATRMAGHGSKEDFIGGTTYLMTFPERGLVVAAMSNISFADLKSVALKVAEIFAK